MIISRKRSILEMAVATACFGAAAAMPVTALAAPQSASVHSAAHNKKVKKQVANANLLHEVVVNGFLSSIQNAIAIQKNSNSIVEAISAQDIGRLPGTSIAASLQQLPGVNVQMVGGRPQAVNVHGLGQDFSTALLDGVEQVTTAQNRGVHFNQFPPGWFKAIKVYISPEADLIGQGLAATFALQTWRPLAEPHREVALNADYRWVTPANLMPGPGVNDKGYGVNGMYINQFDDRKFGVALGFDVDSLPSKRLREAPWGAPGGYPTNSAGVIVPGGNKIYNYSSLRKRDAFFATFQYQPSRAYNTTLDLSYEDYHKTSVRKGMEIPMQWGPATLLTAGPVVNGFMESGTWSTYPVIRNGYTHHKDRIFNIRWGNRFRFADNWTAGFDASYNEAMRNYEKLESYSGFGYNGPASNGAIAPVTINFSYAPDGMMILTSPNNFAASNVVLTDPRGWGAGSGIVQQGFINEQHNEEYLANLKATAAHYFETGPISSVEFGVDYAHHHKNNNIYQYFVTLPGSCTTASGTTLIGACQAPIPASATEGVFDPLSFMGLGPEILYNPNALLASGVTTLYPTALSSLSQSPAWTMHENDTYGFVQFNIQTSLGPDVGLRGNFGLQVAHTSQGSTGQRLAPGSSAGGTAKITLLPVAGGANFTRYLPSLNLVFSFPHNYDARLGIARTMARPKMSDMSAGMSINTNPSYVTNTSLTNSFFSGSGGNPALLPTMATNFNLSLEHYFKGLSGGLQCVGSGAHYSAQCRGGGSTGYVQLSAFYLRLSDFINESAASIFNFTPFESGYLTPAQQAQLGTVYGAFTIPQNDGAGKVYGAQIATNVPLIWGFGVLGSATLSKSAIYYSGSTTPVGVEGLAKWVQNYTLYYARDGFQANVNFNSRTHALASLFGISESRSVTEQRAQHWISAQVSYSFARGRLKGLTLIASGENLGNEPLVDYGNNDPRQITRFETYGRIFHVGFSYKLD